MHKPTLRVYHTYQQELTPQTQLDMRDMQEKYARAELAEMARDRLAWSTNLVSDKRYKLCPDGCGMIHLSRFKNDKHIDPSELIADWQVDEPDKGPDKTQSVDAFMQAPVEVPLRPAVSKAQIMWARSMIDQLGRKTEDQIAEENNVSWKQLQHWARSSTEGLPERKGQKAPAKKSPAKKATKAKVAPRQKAKEA
jgi:hypothetical protein